MTKRIFVFFFLFGLTFSLKAQVTASFIADITEGCGQIPLVSFTNSSTGSGTLSYQWDFGNGNTSSDANPFTSYPNPGSYTVSLTVSNGSQTDVMTIPVNVWYVPVASFTSGAHAGCLPLSVNFQDGSNVTGSTITNWLWYFGDGYSSTEQSPTHIYTTEGNYPVSLTVTDAHGCISIPYNLTDYAQASVVPTISISGDITSYCLTPLTTNFTNNSSGSTPLAFQWNFGDPTSGSANTSTQQNPSHTYNDIGIYDVSLVATDQNGCSNDTVITEMIDISTVTASFNVVEGDTGCLNQMVHFNNTSGTPGIWIYGNGTSGTSDSIIYTATGTYEVTLIAAPVECPDTISHFITIVNPPTTDFLIDSVYGCKVPHNVNFTNTSTGDVSWSWNFGDSGTSTTENPSHTYTGQGNFNVVLTILNQNGCRASQTKNVIVQFPDVSFEADTNMGCVDIPVNFEDNSTCNTQYDNVVGWNWNFDDGQTSNLQNPSHTYTVDGQFWITLTITTQHNCTAKDSVQLFFGSHQLPGFTLDKYIACAQDSIFITNTSADTNKIQTYDWKFGLTLTSNLQHPVPQILRNTVDTGYAHFQLVTNYYGCRDTILDSVYIKGPIIKTRSVVTDLMSCDDPHQYIMTTNTQGAEYWTWDWRDSSLVDTTDQDTVMHQYPVAPLSTPDYMVLVYAFNDSLGCVYKDSIKVYPKDIYANFDSLAWKDTICFDPNELLASTFKDAYFWRWNFGDGTPTTSWGLPLTDHLYDTSGTYTIWLYAKTMSLNELQCVDSISRQVRVFKPEVEFYGDTLIGCAQSPITIPFHSQAFSPDTNIVSWLWNLGDNQTSTDTAFSHSYPTPGKYNITLEVTDGFGCINSLTKNQYIASLAVTSNFTLSQTVYCTGDDILLNSSSTSIPTDYPPTDFHWYLSNGDSSYQQSPTISFPVKGDYDVTLIVFNALGCSDTLIRPAYIQSQSIDAGFYVTLNNMITSSDNLIAVVDTNCYPVNFNPINLVNTTLEEYNPTTYSWTFGNGVGSSNLTSPSFPYEQPGNYELILQTTTSHGCVDTDTITINVGGPWANILLDDDHICKGDTVSFNVTDTISIQSVTWDFGDGSISHEFAPAHDYTYFPDTGFFVVTLNATSGSCQMPLKKDTINIYQVIADFLRNDFSSGTSDTSGCGPFLADFTNQSTGADSWYWDFGNGSIFNGQNPATQTFVNNAASDVIYNVALYISESMAGCVDTAIKQIVVHPTPVLALTNDTIICLGATAQLNASGGSTILWSPANALSDTMIYHPVASPVTTTTYHALITSDKGCTNEDSVKIAVQQIPNLSTIADTTIIIGESINLSTTVDQDNTSYQWLPDYKLSCNNCDEPVATPLRSTDYIITISDSIGCFSVSKLIRIIVDAKFSIDVPTVFTPNGDGHNDIIFAKGWGVKQFRKFQIYNRWGQLVYETDDKTQGWNGTFNGMAQPADTYPYFIEVELLDETFKTKQGNFSLLR